MTESPDARAVPVQRLLIEIDNWDCNLFVGRAPDSMPEDERFLGGLFVSQGIDVDGRVIFPREHVGKRFRTSFCVVAPEVSSDGQPYSYLGALRERPAEDRRADFDASTILSERAFAPTVAALGSVWKYLHIWVIGRITDGSAIRDYCFSRTAWDANV